MCIKLPPVKDTASDKELIAIIKNTIKYNEKLIAQALS